jgi:hypothetical protein
MYICSTNLPPALLCALYGPKYPADHVFDILVGAVRNHKGVHEYVARAIVYTDSQCSNWKLVKTGRARSNRCVISLEEFVKELRIEFGTLAGKSSYGATEYVMFMRRLESMEKAVDANVRDALALPPLEGQGQL